MKNTLGMMKRLILGAMLFCASGPIWALTYTLNNGLLVGINGVDVNGTLYNVSFVDSSCIALFNGCDVPAEDFPFSDDASTLAASQAILDLLQDGVDGEFDTDPNTMNGITLGIANLLTPTGFWSNGNVKAGFAINNIEESDDSVYLGAIGKTDDLTEVPHYVYAVWEEQGNPVGTHTLIVSSANGTVTSSPSGINCGATCSAEFNIGDSVTLSANPSLDHYFVGWGGGCSGTQTTCILSMSTPMNVTATFAASDSDNDGVPDYADMCPSTGDQGFGVDPDGCPYTDTDGDGALDHLDLCRLLRICRLNSVPKCV